MRRVKQPLSVLVSTFALVVGLQAPALAETIEVQDAYVRAVPPGQSNSAAFMRITNHGDKERALLAGASDQAEVVELHTHRMEDGMMRMRQVGQIDLPAGETVILEPGGLHVMLIGLTETLAPGHEVTLTLDFDGGDKQRLNLPVKRIEPSATAEDEPANAANPAEQPGASETARPDAGSAKRLGVELNKLEQADGSCRVYLVFENALGTKLAALQLELILFDTDGFIKDHVTLDAAPIDADKTSVKRFDLAETQCERVGRILVNDVLAMASPEGALPDPISRLDLSSKLDVDLFK